MADSLHKIQIEIPTRVRRRLELVKALLAQTRPGLGNPTWSQCVELLADLVPIGQLLSDVISGAEPIINGDANATEPEPEPEPAKPADGNRANGRRRRNDNRA